MKTCSAFILSSLIGCVCNAKSQDQIWPQFRGLNGSGVAVESSRPPIVFEDSNLLWKTGLPPGVSSPVVWKMKERGIIVFLSTGPKYLVPFLRVTDTRSRF